MNKTMLASALLCGSALAMTESGLPSGGSREKCGPVLRKAMMASLYMAKSVFDDPDGCPAWAYTLVMVQVVASSIRCSLSLSILCADTQNGWVQHVRSVRSTRLL